MSTFGRSNSMGGSNAFGNSGFQGMGNTTGGGLFGGGASSGNPVFGAAAPAGMGGFPAPQQQQQQPGVAQFGAAPVGMNGMMGQNTGMVGGAAGGMGTFNSFNTPAAGQVPGFGVGANNAFGGGAVPAQKPLFGGNTFGAPQTTSAFGNPAPAGGLFGANPSATNSGSSKVNYKPTKGEYDNSVAKYIQYQSISCMKDYDSISTDELRWQDYQRGAKPNGANPGGIGGIGGVGQPPFAAVNAANPMGGAGAAGGAFGMRPPTQMGTSVFGQSGPAQAQPFGAPTAAPQSNLFGGAFGQQQQPQQPAQPTPFGAATAPNVAGGGFRAQQPAAIQTGTNLFGGANPNPNPNPLGGAPQPGGAGGGVLFGQQQPQQPAFGAAAPLGGMPAFGAGSGGGTAPAFNPAFGGGAFGQQQQPQQQTQLQMPQPGAAPSLFGQTAGAAGTNLFGGGGGAGSSTLPPSTGFGVGGAAATAAPLGSSGTNWLGGQTGGIGGMSGGFSLPGATGVGAPGAFGQTQAPLGGGQATSLGGMTFGQSGTAGGVFGSTAKPATAAAAPAGGGAFNFGGFGGSTATSTLAQASSGSMPPLQTATPQNFTTLPSSGSNGGAAMAPGQGNPTAACTYGMDRFKEFKQASAALQQRSSSLGGGGGTEPSAATPRVLGEITSSRPVVNVARIKPYRWDTTTPDYGDSPGGSHSHSHSHSHSVGERESGRKAHLPPHAAPAAGSSALQSTPSLKDMLKFGSPLDRLRSAAKNSDASPHTKHSHGSATASSSAAAATGKNGSQSKSVPSSPGATPVKVSNGNGAAAAVEKEGGTPPRGETSLSSTHSSHSKPKPKDRRSSEGRSLLPKLSKAGYYMEPAMETLEHMSEEDLRCVHSFTVGRHGYGKVEWTCPVNVCGLDLNRDVVIGLREVTVYPDHAHRPSNGTGLNAPARLSIEQCFPKHHSPHKGMSSEEIIKYAAKLMKANEKDGATYKNYDHVQGKWIFEVEHFSRYGLDADSDDEVEDPRVEDFPDSVSEEEADDDHDHQSESESNSSGDDDMESGSSVMHDSDEDAVSDSSQSENSSSESSEAWEPLSPAPTPYKWQAAHMDRMDQPALHMGEGEREEQEESRRPYLAKKKYKQAMAQAQAPLLRKTGAHFHVPPPPFAAVTASPGISMAARPNVDIMVPKAQILEEVCRPALEREAEGRSPAALHARQLAGSFRVSFGPNGVIALPVTTTCSSLSRRQSNRVHLRVVEQPRGAADSAHSAQSSSHLSPEMVSAIFPLHAAVSLSNLSVEESLSFQPHLRSATSVGHLATGMLEHLASALGDERAESAKKMPMPMSAGKSAKVKKEMARCSLSELTHLPVSQSLAVMATVFGTSGEGSEHQTCLRREGLRLWCQSYLRECSSSSSSSSLVDSGQTAKLLDQLNNQSHNRLATLVAAASPSHLSTETIRRAQECNWDSEALLTSLMGQVQSENAPVSWEQLLSRLLWHHPSHARSISNAMMGLESFLSAQDPSAYDKLVPVSSRAILALLRLWISLPFQNSAGGMSNLSASTRPLADNLADVLNPACAGLDVTDGTIPWLMLSLLRAQGLPAPASRTLQATALLAAHHLEAHGQWPWALYILRHSWDMSESVGIDNAPSASVARQLLGRHCPPLMMEDARIPHAQECIRDYPQMTEELDRLLSAHIQQRGWKVEEVAHLWREVRCCPQWEGQLQRPLILFLRHVCRVPVGWIVQSILDSAAQLHGLQLLSHTVLLTAPGWIHDPRGATDWSWMDAATQALTLLNDRGLALELWESGEEGRDILQDLLRRLQAMGAEALPDWNLQGQIWEIALALRLHDVTAEDAANSLLQALELCERVLSASTRRKGLFAVAPTVTNTRSMAGWRDQFVTWCTFRMLNAAAKADRLDQTVTLASQMPVPPWASAQVAAELMPSLLNRHIQIPLRV
jgi:hypothetical protein